MKEKHSFNYTGFYRKAFTLIIDLALFSLANASVVYLTMGGHVTSIPYSAILFDYGHFFLVSTLLFLINMVFGLYKLVLTFFDVNAMIRYFLASFCSTAMLVFVDRIIFGYLLGYEGRLPFYAYILMLVLAVFCTSFIRIGYSLIRKLFNYPVRFSGNHKRVMIVGAGFMGNFIIDNLIVNRYASGCPVCAVDDNPVKLNKRINGVKIAGTCAEIPKLAKKYKIDTIIICMPSASKVRQKEIINIALKTKCIVKISPSVEEFLEDGSDSTKKARNVEITDLLARPEIKLDKKVCRYLFGETVLVTGGGGSIGAELCTQVARYNPKTIVIFDIYENCAFELANELNRKYGDSINIQVRIGSVRDINRLHDIFEEFHPDVIFHAAAHKHVPLMEDSPCEAVKNNVFGTYNVAVTADEFKVPKMVIISTDKAVNPTNVMGCTKRITEIIAQYMNKKSENTDYAAVRFGNVLGSHGSVIPIFKSQIERGGPITLTHPDIERYFMTIPEAAQLVCQAGGLAKGGEVFVLDMGEPVKIMDLAKNLIQLSGFEIDEIGIEITGLRPGEKLYEELALESELETRKTTALEKIYVTQPMDIDDKEFASMLESLRDINDDNVREKLKAIVPNFHPSQNETDKQ